MRIEAYLLRPAVLSGLLCGADYRECGEVASSRVTIDALLPGRPPRPSSHYDVLETNVMDK